MNSGPRHARKKEIRRASALLRVGLSVTAAGTAVVGSAGMANAADPSRVETPLGELDTTAVHQPTETLESAVENGAGGVVGPVADLQLDPLAGTGSDPLANGVGTQIADFKPIGTQAVTGPFARGASLDELPLVRAAGGTLPG